jgi:hypothetical protein
MSKDLTTQTPVEIDTELARIWSLIDRADEAIAHIKHDLARKLTYGLRKGELALVGANRELAEANLARYQEALVALRAEAAPFNAEYDRRGRWHRYFLVDNTNGHVHRDMGCSTCFPTTRYKWLIELADCNEDAMIEEWGEMACTVCFPSAPTNPLYNRPSRRDREAQEARAAEKAARQAVKDAKGITDVDGSPLRGEYGVIKTKVAARNELSSAFSSLAWYGLDHPQDFAAKIRHLIPALEAAGVDWRKAATNAIKRTAKEINQPNPYAHQLTAEQVAETAAKQARSLAQAQALLAEVL